MKHRSMVVRALKTFFSLPFDLGRDPNGRAHKFHDMPIPSINGTLDALYCPIMETIGIEPTQVAILNGLQVQSDTLAVRIDLADMRYNQQPAKVAFWLSL